MKIITRRYMWSLVGDDKKVNLKVVTDTVEGLELFEKNLKALENVDKVGYEYVCDYDVSQLGKFVDLKNI